MYIIGPDSYRIDTISYSLKQNVVELISEDGNTKRFQIDDNNKDFIANVMQYQTIIDNDGCYLEHKKMLHLFCDIIMERLIEL